MERVMALLAEKNGYLERFFTINEHELINLSEGCFDNVETFYQAREKILELIRCIDQLILEENLRYGVAAIPQTVKSEAEALLKAKDEWVEAILAQDLQILSYVEREKSNIIRELRTTQQARRAVSAYRSPDFVNQLDEKI